MEASIRRLHRTLAVALCFMLLLHSSTPEVLASEYISAPEDAFLFVEDALPEVEALPAPYEEADLSAAEEDPFISIPWDDSSQEEPFDTALVAEGLPEEEPSMELTWEGEGLFPALEAEAAEEGSDPLDLFTSSLFEGDEATEDPLFGSDDLVEDAGAVSYVVQRWADPSVIPQIYSSLIDPVPSNGTMTSGWYYLNRNITKKGRLNLTGDVRLVLGDGCTLDVKGISVPQGSTLTVYGQTEGTGKIYSHPDSGAGIGGYTGYDNGNIVIHGGIIEAVGAKHCAGIGSNDGCKTGSITIYGGTITATGGSYAAGIGGGRDSDGGNITIYGGNITATGKDSSAGIGGDDPINNRADKSTITIYGGTINAKGNSKGAGIGGGEYGSATITISGGQVTATGGNKGGAGIGSGADGTGSTIKLFGGTIAAYAADSNAYAIGNGKNKAGSNSIITLSERGSDRPITITAASYGGKVTLYHFFKSNAHGVIPMGPVLNNLILPGTVTNIQANPTTWAQLQDMINALRKGNTITITLTCDITAIPGGGEGPLLIPDEGKLTIDLNGYTLNRNLISATENGSVIDNHGVLTITDTRGGGKITGGWTTGSGGGIYT